MPSSTISNKINFCYDTKYKNLTTFYALTYVPSLLYNYIVHGEDTIRKEF